MGKKGPQEKNIQVVVRCRPRNDQEIKDGSPSVVECLPSKREICVRQENSDHKSMVMNKTFGFDRVFGPDASQLDVYRYIMCPLLEEVLLGYNCTVFAYGQTGTGKTFTMEGEKSSEGGSWDKEPQSGIIPRAMKQLFERLEALPDCEFSVRVSFLEIYNEDLFDLLGSSLDTQKLRLFEDSARKGSVFIQGLEEMIVHDKNEVYEILERGRAKRQTAATIMNAHSSRSHSLFSVTVHIKENSVTGEEMLKTGKLNLVDLAGSENVGRSGAVDKRLREAGTINQSLLALGRVITALVERAPHVPYRESKLTRLLQDSLGGRTKTSIIATISPATCNMEETLSTLDYAHRAKNILNRPEINQKLTKKALIKEYTEEIDRLKKDLLAAREKNGIFLAVENYNELQNKLKSNSEVITETQEKLSHLETEFTKLTALFKDTSEELAGTKECLHRSNDILINTKAMLKQMIEDRDGLEYLVENYSKTEENLHDKASTLLGVVHDVSSDNERLHSKLERKVLVERQNTERIDMFRRHYASTIKIMETNLKTYRCEQEQKSKELVQWIDDLTSRKSEELELRSMSFEEMISRHQEVLKNILDSDQRNANTCREWSNRLSRNSTEKKDEVLEILRHDCLEMFRSVQETLNFTSTFLKDFSSSVTERLMEQHRNVKDLFERTERDLTSLENKLKDHFLQQSKNVQERLEKQKMADSEQERLRTEVNGVIDQLRKLVDEKHTVTRSNSAEVVENLLETTAADTNTAEECTSLVASLNDSNSCFLRYSCSTFDDATKEVHRRTRTATEKVETTSKIFPRIEESTKNVKNGIEKITGEWDRLVEDSLADNFGSISEHLSRQEHIIKETIKDTDSILNEMKTTLASYKLSRSDMASSWKENINICESSFATWAIKHNAQLNDIGETFAQFVEEDLTEDMPTGATPVRRQYNYPVDLPRTERQKLLEAFKENYDPPPTPQHKPAIYKDEVFVNEDGTSDDERYNHSVAESEGKSDDSSSSTSSVGKENECNENDQTVAQDTIIAKAKSVEPLTHNDRSPLQTRNTNTNHTSGAVKRSKLPRARNTSTKTK